MSENTPPVNPPAAAEPPKTAEASGQKKQTVRISLPPKPAGGPSIRVPAAAAPSPAQVAAPATPAVPAPAAAPMAAAPAASPAAKAAAAPAGAAAKPAAGAPAARPAAKSASLSGLDLGLAFATMVLGIAAVAVQFFVAN